MEARSGATIEIEDDGTVTVSARNAESLAGAKAMIEGLTEELKIGAIYPAKVVSLKDFGAFCEITGKGKDGLVHVTEITDAYVQTVDQYLQIGMDVEIKLISTDPSGKNRFSIKAARKERRQPAPERLRGTE